MYNFKDNEISANVQKGETVLMSIYNVEVHVFSINEGLSRSS